MIFPLVASLVAIFTRERDEDAPRLRRLQAGDEGFEDWMSLVRVLVAADVPLDVVEAFGWLIDQVPPATWPEARPLLDQLFAEVPTLSYVSSGDRWAISFPGYVVVAEGWAEACLSEGIGPWSSLELGEEAIEPPGSLEGRIEAYQEEAHERWTTLAPGDPDAAPGDTLIAEAWIAAQGHYDALHLSLWEVSRP